MNWYLDVLQKYAVFNGRARRKEYWMFILFNSIFSFGIAFIEGVVRGPALQEGAAPIFGSIYGLPSHSDLQPDPGMHGRNPGPEPLRLRPQDGGFGGGVNGDGAMIASDRATVRDHRHA
jgi:hypothetical protein